MDVFERFRKDSEPSPLAVPEFERIEEAWFVGCPHGDLVCPIHWVDVYGKLHCAWCDFPPAMAVVRRVLCLVPTSLPDDHVVSLDPGEPCDVVVRPDMLGQWRRLERQRAARKAQEQQEPDNGY